jgi:hypothetical protein
MILDRTIHFVARSLLRVCSPDRALTALRSLCSPLPALTNAGAARVLRSLAGRGSCLSRSLTVAARAPETTVAIGVDPRRERFFAHAWVEADGRPLDASDPAGEIMVRLPASSAANGSYGV